MPTLTHVSAMDPSPHDVDCILFKLYAGDTLRDALEVRRDDPRVLAMALADCIGISPEEYAAFCKLENACMYCGAEWPLDAEESADEPGVCTECSNREAV